MIHCKWICYHFLHPVEYLLICFHPIKQSRHPWQNWKHKTIKDKWTNNLICRDIIHYWRSPVSIEFLAQGPMQKFDSVFWWRQTPQPAMLHTQFVFNLCFFMKRFLGWNSLVLLGVIRFCHSGRTIYNQYVWVRRHTLLDITIVTVILHAVTRIMWSTCEWNIEKYM